MTASDWIALGGALVAGIALVVSSLALRQQRRTQHSDDVNQFGELMQRVRDAFAQLSKQRALDRDSYANISAANATLQGLALQANELVESVHPQWFDIVVLASAFSQCMDAGHARVLWERAIETAETSQGDERSKVREVRTLTMAARFYYLQGLPDELTKGRCLLTKAQGVLDADVQRQGPTWSSLQAIELSVSRADFELQYGNDAEAISAINEAVDRCGELHTRGAKDQAEQLIKLFVQEQQVIAKSEFRLPPGFGFPPVPTEGRGQDGSPSPSGPRRYFGEADAPPPSEQEA